MAVMTMMAGAGPSVAANSAPPNRCPLVPAPSGKLTIWAANTNAPSTPIIGTCDSSRSFREERAARTTAGAATAHRPPHTGAARNPSGICISRFPYYRVALR
jgi:hypothetical protein